MPEAALRTGAADFVLPLAEIAPALHAGHDQPQAMSSAEEERFEHLLVFLQQQRGFDFTGYKRPSLVRRVLRRMQMLGLREFDAYSDYLQVHPEEFGQLFNTILINVTSFFRDPHAWEYLEKRVLPEILKAKSASETVRVWSAGCASGQEAYTVAILFAEALGAQRSASASRSMRPTPTRKRSPRRGSPAIRRRRRRISLPRCASATSSP